MKKLNKKDKKQKLVDLSLESDVRDILISLSEIINAMISTNEDQTEASKTISSLTDRIKKVEDNSEHHHQRSLRGKFFISFPPDSSPISPEELVHNCTSVKEYVRDLVESKYQVRIGLDDFKTCHHTKKGLIFRLQNLSSGSSYAGLAQAIKNGTGKKIKTHYVNFSLTPLRSSLLYDLRSYKREKKIERYYSDMDGTLSYILNEGDRRTRCTSIHQKDSDGFHMKTFSNEELRLKFFPGDNADESSSSEDPNTLSQGRSKRLPSNYTQ